MTMAYDSFVFVCPQYKWPTVKRDSGEREMKMIYKFDYLPAGLFNRAQVG